MFLPNSLGPLDFFIFFSAVYFFFLDAMQVGADALTRWVDWTDRNTCVAFLFLVTSFGSSLISSLVSSRLN